MDAEREKRLRDLEDRTARGEELTEGEKSWLEQLRAEARGWSRPVGLQHGLTDEQEGEVQSLLSEIADLRNQIQRLPQHRSLSIAMTKLDEAGLWLRDRLDRPA